jgi:TonB-dependent SusC/RagA subfamily outer membrane receptor
MRRIIILAAFAAVLCACGTSQKSTRVYTAGDHYEGEDINVGYGTVNSRDLTYSVSQVEVNDKEVIAYTNIWDYLRGRVPGVMIGEAGPGQTPKITVRGLNSISSSTQPLIVLDGVETEDISFLNPNDVANVSVLKDASASIYGTRGGNGVIIITTKSANESAKLEAEARRAAREARRAARKK